MHQKTEHELNRIIKVQQGTSQDANYFYVVNSAFDNGTHLIVRSENTLGCATSDSIKVSVRLVIVLVARRRIRRNFRLKKKRNKADVMIRPTAFTHV